ncbi:MAG: aldo/keto reductase [Treponema sp.]|nr:aldo/keto reductase [Treponema sp.]
MQYVDFGKTGVKVSRLGMGVMRLPNKDVDGKSVPDEEKSIALLQRAVELGVNYFDSAPYYCDSQSEPILGKAVKGMRDKVYISTKNPLENSNGDDFEKRLEKSLKNLQTDYIDFYHFWGISLNAYNNSVMAEDGPMARARKLKEQGVIKHISFSYHDRDAGAKEGGNLEELLRRSDGLLESLLCQYNIMDRNKESGIALAHKMGLGTVVMGPVGGGLLAAPLPAIQALLPANVRSSAEIALRFVFSNQNINIALSGMSNIGQLEENAAIASNTQELTQAERSQIEDVMKENERLAELYCTGCRYCMPCPNGINIPAIFGFMNYHRVHKLTDHAKGMYGQIGKVPWFKFENASKCTECGACEKKCPQAIPIIAQLKETHAVLAG